jgi:hypothetical protein
MSTRKNVYACKQLSTNEFGHSSNTLTRLFGARYKLILQDGTTPLMCVIEADLDDEVLESEHRFGEVHRDCFEMLLAAKPNLDMQV